MENKIYVRQENQGYTPSKLEDTNITLHIPIYQRLFVWEASHINQLLEDLYLKWQSSLNSPEPYYIGNIIVRKSENEWEVVDGQQRLTFLMLFGCVFGGKWGDFLFSAKGIDSRPQRIYYTGRKEDNECLYGFYESQGEKDLLNPNMECFRLCLKHFRNGEVGDGEQRKARFNDSSEELLFSEYVFHFTTFLVSFLPCYTPHQLNTIFEKMNSSGRQLEQDEIVKGMFFSSRAAKCARATSQCNTWCFKKVMR